MTMMTTVTYLLVISAITALAAWTAELGLRRAGVPTRWVWLAAMLTGPALLAAAALLPESSPMRGVGGAVGPVIELPAFEVGPAPTAFLGVEGAVLVGWLLASLAMIVLVVRTRLRLGHERRAWKEADLDGRRVWLSSDRGPAVTGVLRPWIVLPGWFEELPASQRALVLLHEEEHVRGGDTLLLPVALGLLCFTPWNPLTWLHFRRLRAAVEVDCDRRVLRRSPDPASYGDSLIAVAARTSGISLGLAAFTEHPGTLERRIIAMTHRRTPWSSFRAALFTLLAVAIAAQACGVEGPVQIDQSQAALVEIPEDSDGPMFEAREMTKEEIAAEPTFTPFTVAPAITNRDQVVRAMSESYPPLLKDAGIGGTVRVFFFINEQGIVEQVRIDESSGHEALDDAALNVAGVYQFTPALNQEKPVPVWVSFPITYQVR
jgi:TonB family protein